MTSEKKQLSLIFTLLAVLVIVPTVCMLWFVVRAAQNEQFAIKQRLIDKYEVDVKQSVFLNIPQFFQTELDKAHKLFKEQYDLGRDLCYQELHKNENRLSNSLIEYIYVFDRTGWKIQRDDSFVGDSPAVFDKAEELEFQQNNLEAAAKEYGRIVEKYPEYAAIAYSGMVRCMRKAGKLKDAIDTSLAALSPEKGIFKQGGTRYWQMKLLLADMYSQAGRSELSDSIKELNNCAFDVLSYGTKAFILSKAIELIDSNNLQYELSDTLDIAQKERAYAQFLMSIEENFSDGYDGSLDMKLIDYSGDDKQYYTYAGHGNYSSHLIYCVLDTVKLKAYLDKELSALTDDMIFVDIFDSENRFIAGEEVKPVDDFLGRQKYQETIFALDIPYSPLKNWKIWCAFRPGVFGFAAANYKMIYIWTAIMVLVLAGTAAIYVGRLLLNQARINRLKNDFIATVTHELKTPLTSTRMLVDTLLADKYEDSNTVKEYLQIISRENARLNSLIDNFLTFSRMERSRQVFDKQKLDINELLSEAAAIFNKKEDKKLIFTVTKCPESRLILVDRQAMLTVILNLLSNAWKYTEKEPKEIELKAFIEKEKVCFSVKDNGVGLTVRQQKKIFDRFYRVDDSLSRRTEGTGIGLTIVKFIVDAHNGIITVTSRPGEGTEFIVELKCG